MKHAAEIIKSTKDQSLIIDDDFSKQNFGKIFKFPNGMLMNLANVPYNKITKLLKAKDIGWALNSNIMPGLYMGSHIDLDENARIKLRNFINLCSNGKI